MDELWLWISSTGWTGVAAIAGSVTALGTGVLAYFAASSLRAAVRDSHGRSRPVIVPTIRPDRWADGADLVIRNYGPSPAFNVTVRLSESYLQVPFEEGSNNLLYRQFLERKYSMPLPCWAPGQEERSRLVWGPETAEGSPNFFDEVELEISYDGPGRSPKGRRGKTSEPEFREEFTLPLHHTFHELHQTSSRDLDQQMKKVISALEGISNGVRSSASVLEDLSNGRI